MRTAAALIAVLGTVQAAHAVSVSLRWQVSVNGAPFQNSQVGGVFSGSILTFRLRASLVDNIGAGSIGGSGGLAGFNFLPTLTNLHPLDVVQPLGSEQHVEGSAQNPFPGVINHPTLGSITNVYTGTPATFRGPGNVSGTGRNAPFGAAGTSADGVAAPSMSGSTLSWRSPLIANTGVSLSQRTRNESLITAITGVDDAGTPVDPSDDALIETIIGSFANNSRTNITLFTYSIQANFPYDETYNIASCEILSPTIDWYTSASGSIASVPLDSVTIEPAIVLRVFPAPGPVALLGVAGLFAARRRRA